MRVYTKAGDLAFKTHTFSDGQPHFKLETYEREFDTVTIELAIKSPGDLFLVLLVSDVLRTSGYANIQLDIRYLLGARMDRAISSMEPFTLHTVARLINSCGFTRVRILDAHSEVATRLIRNSTNLLPFSVVRQVLTVVGNPLIIIPDKGARDRVTALASDNSRGGPELVQCYKRRDPATGALDGFTVGSPVTITRQDCLIIDDICDGGGTFVGLAKELRKAGATSVSLFVTHGIFSKGLPLEGIDKIYTTDSYFTLGGSNGCWIDLATDKLVVIPISMEKL